MRALSHITLVLNVWNILAEKTTSKNSDTASLENKERK